MSACCVYGVRAWYSPLASYQDVKGFVRGPQHACPLSHKLHADDLVIQQQGRGFTNVEKGTLQWVQVPIISLCVMCVWCMGGVCDVIDVWDVCGV